MNNNKELKPYILKEGHHCLSTRIYNQIKDNPNKEILIAGLLSKTLLAKIMDKVGYDKVNSDFELKHIKVGSNDLLDYYPDSGYITFDNGCKVMIKD